MRFRLIALCLLSLTAFSAQAKSPLLSAKQLAIAAFDSFLGMDKTLNGQISELEKAGLAAEPKSTDAIMLNWGCGAAGCDSLHLVTKTYASAITGTVISAIVETNTTRQYSRVRRVLETKDLADLLK